MTEACSGYNSSTGEVHQTLRLTTMLLNGTNYPSWARFVTLSLQGKGKLDHITDDSVKTDPNWKTNDINVMNCLLNSMEPLISRLFMYLESAKEIWEETKEMFGQEQNLAYIFHLKQELAKINQGTKTVTEYYGDLKVKWDEIGLYSHTTDLKALEQDKIFQFLSGLDPSYEPIRAQILLSKELPKLRAVVAMVQREESRRTLMNPHPALELESQAFTAHHRNHSFKGEIRGAATARCDNCKKEGHSRDACWFLYPELRPKRKDRGGGDRTKKKGVDRDWERKGYGAVNLDNADKTKSQGVHEATSAYTARLPNEFSQAQQDQLGNLSQAQQD
jgi:gag-polypeptide of LTR copia-type